MSPRWRTPTVRALCRRLLDGRELDALPILGDALEEAGCDDGELLALCRNSDLKPVLAERAVNLAYSHETGAAVGWLERFGRDIGYGGDPPMYAYEDIVQAGHGAVRDGGYCWGTDAGAEFIYESDNRREFFRDWSLVTGWRSRKKPRRASTSAAPAGSGQRSRASRLPRRTPPR